MVQPTTTTKAYIRIKLLITLILFFYDFTRAVKKPEAAKKGDPHVTSPKNLKLTILKRLVFLSLILTPYTQKAQIDSINLFEKIGIEALQLNTENVDIVKSVAPYPTTKKIWTVMLYIAADNDLAAFAIRNIKQMTKIGSNENFNLVIHLDIKKANGEKTTRRYYVEQGKILHLNADDPQTQALDSGDPATLIAFCDWAIANFPAERYGIILWNHGSGAFDPERGRIVSAEEFVTFNPFTQKLELDRSLGYLERMQPRGVCFDDSTNHYLSNAKIDSAFNTICTRCLDGEKFDFIGFDACLMQMAEVANIIKKYAHVMIGSEEVELGYGWDYTMALEPFSQGEVAIGNIAEHIVASFGKSYEKITSDYTLSALNLDAFPCIEDNINAVAQLLLDGIKQQKDGFVKKTIKASRNRTVCTYFEEPSYIDLHHFYNNLLTNINNMKLKSAATEKTFKNELKSLLEEGISLIESIAFTHTQGKNLARARGLSIYFPEQRIYSAYKRLPFAQENAWLDLLVNYIAA